MQASNGVDNLRGTDRDIAAAQIKSNPTLEEQLEKQREEQREAIMDHAEKLLKDAFNPDFVTRQEFNELLERIAKFNRISSHPL